MNTFQIILGILMLMAPLFLFVSIILFLISFFKKEEMDKKKLRKKGWLFLIPIALIFILTTLWGLFNQFI
jgi:NADH:ubiquinone oxidoreductase subunit 5 (subunit L)/multisubunit Na+/H+ antiporter MnhA subunit